MSWFRSRIAQALKEDAPRGDITSQCFSSNKHSAATITAKQAGVIAGLELAKECFRLVDRRIVITSQVNDGAKVKPKDSLLSLTGPLPSILLAERTALNFLQHLSGVATATAQLVKLLAGTNCQLLDTRKTTPGWRDLEKYAVRCGGGQNHRSGLSDMLLVKENHLAGLSNTEITVRVLQARKKYPRLQIEIEAETLAQVKLFLSLPIDRILLDNMSVIKLRQAVALRNKNNKNIMLEASGNITTKTIRGIAKTGVDYISCGAITHSAPALDCSLRIQS